jgi:hypothetical protein
MLDGITTEIQKGEAYVDYFTPDSVETELVVQPPKGSSEWRKQRPICTGVLDPFKDALMEVAFVSYMGNKQHNAGKPLQWDKSKSKDEADALVRHLSERGTFDSDNTRHSAKVAWRALALLQREIDAEYEEG